MPASTASEQTSLNNYGFSFLRFDPEVEDVGTGTFVVVGVPRSGTTMIARVLRELELLAPTASSGVVLEDTVLAQAISDNDEPALTQEIERRNRDLPKWGTKRPDFYKHMPLLDRVLRKPRYIATFRDPLSIAERNRIAVHQDVLVGLNRAASDTLRLIEAISRTTSPCLLISYEKALFYPDKILQAIERFCGVEADDTQRRSVLAGIRPNEPAYVDAARFKYEGHVDGIKNGRVWGWARRVGDVRPVDIEVVKKRSVLAAGTADLPRPDLNRMLKGNCAFEILVGRDILDDPEIVVRIKTANVVLGSSASSRDAAVVRDVARHLEERAVRYPNE